MILGIQIQMGTPMLYKKPEVPKMSPKLCKNISDKGFTDWETLISKLIWIELCFSSMIVMNTIQIQIVGKFKQET